MPTPWFPRPSITGPTWPQSNGYTADAYLTTPVGVDSLNFGKHAFKNLSAWNNAQRHQRHPGLDGRAGDRCQRRRQPLHAAHAPRRNDLSVPTPPSTWPTPSRRSRDTRRSTTSLAHHDWQYIDTNHDGVITAQELTNFVDNSAAMGLPEAGAMAALLGGTATYSAVEPGLNNEVFNENPDDPAAEQRRFNFFDYAADGQLNGSVTINEFKMLGRILLPSPDAYDDHRSPASLGQRLLAGSDRPAQLRRLAAHLAHVPMGAASRQVKKYRNISPAKFGVDKGQTPGTTFPLYTLFDPVAPRLSSSPAPRPSCRPPSARTSTA